MMPVWAARRRMIMTSGSRSPVDLPPVGTPLESCTWAQIKAISDAGLASEYFAVGNTKSVHVQGTIGTLAIDETFFWRIIGIDHNSNLEGTGITFWLSTNAKGVEVAICDRYAWDYVGFCMNTDGTTSGGWESSYMRHTILGSDGNPINPAANTFLAALPADLRAVMKPMTIYTDNTGDSIGTSDAVTATTDYLPLLAEFEYFGDRIYANSYEQGSQRQYAYFAAKNYPSKVQHNATDTAVHRWMRSPYDATRFCITHSNGAIAFYVYAHKSGGVAPIFRV